MPFFARSLTLVPRFLLLNRTETLATQAIEIGVSATPAWGLNYQYFRKTYDCEKSGFFYCTVLCCAVMLLVSIEDICIAHVLTNIFIIESVCNQ